ncbi:MAG: hypothetical protein U0V75_16300 [Ferruginibacter sp.]
MKKIFTLVILTTATFSFTSAQPYGQKNDGFKEDKKPGNDFDGRNGFDKSKTAGYKDSYFIYKQKVEQVNREFDRKIAEVKHSWRLNGREKEGQIRFLQMQRQNALDKLQYDFEKSNRQYKEREHGHNEHW